MAKSVYKTLGIGIDTHSRLKALAKTSGLPITSWLDQVVGYFHRTGLDPQDLGSQGEVRVIQGMKKQLDFLVRLVKSQEKKLLEPLSESVLELQFQMQEVGLRVDIACPSCKGDFRGFIEEADHLICQGCGLRFRIVFGATRLNDADILCLLIGGMTRRFEELKSPDGELLSCRFYLDPEQHYTLNMQL